MSLALRFKLVPITAAATPAPQAATPLLEKVKKKLSQPTPEDVEKKKNVILSSLDQAISRVLHNKALNEDEKWSQYNRLMSDHRGVSQSTKRPPLKTSEKAANLASFINTNDKVQWTPKYELMADNQAPIKGSNINKLVHKLATSKKPSGAADADILLQKLLDANVDPALVPSLPIRARKPIKEKALHKTRARVIRKRKDDFAVKEWTS
jgi:hypothetical protein